ncbi:MAG: tRNA-uridine 2-sulfurtransferase [Actinomycetota bacterium]
MRVLAAMSGGVDSSVAVALLLEQGHDVAGATMKLWRGAAVEVGCCSEAEIDDARRVATRLGVDHHVFTFTDDFDRHVVDPYVAGHAAGRTPNPCIACNDRIKFDRFLQRSQQLGFDAVATGHHARVERAGGRVRLLRGVDGAKDQSYVLHGLPAATLARCVFPVGHLTKADVRSRAAELDLPVATKPDSQDACFVLTEGGRRAFLGERIPLRPGRLLDSRTGADAGTVAALELVTVGQRRGMGGAGQRRYALAVDVAAGTVTVGPREATMVDAAAVPRMRWVHDAVGPDDVVLAQCSAHGDPVPARYVDGVVRFGAPRPRVAPGQSVVLYDGDEVLGGGEAA